jgi:Asp-tRNA(Asn)/Glu-tRNA(Gln) amidotransferase A subunit family amidase
MSISDSIVDRMRANLAAAGIPLAPHDLDALVAGPFLESVVLFDRRPVGAAAGGLPDYLGDLEQAAPGVNAGVAAAETPALPGSDREREDLPSIRAMAERVCRREVSPVELTGQALRRISARDLELNAFRLVLAERALEAARRAEEEIGRGEWRGPLHGIPVAVKDLLALEGTPTTAGSRVLADAESDFDAASVARLKEAGAVIVGKTRMSEFAYLPGSSNAHFGPTRNPHDPSRDAGGSSSGSAVAVADGMAYAALGTDTGGSIRVPAAFCGIVGLKPTFGRTSLHGAVPLAWSLDHLGPLTRTVDDAALLLEVLSGPDPRDARTLRPGGSPPLRLDPDAGVRGLRIGVPSGGGPGSPAGVMASDGAWAVARGAVAALADAGAEVIDVDLPEVEELWVANNVILAIEAAAFHEPWLQTRLDEYGEIPRQRLIAAYAHAQNAFVRAQAMRRSARERVLALFQRIDLLATPAQPDVAPPLGQWRSTLLTGPFNALGWPALTVPAGADAGGLPLAVQLVGRPWEEGLALRAGKVVERASAQT